MDLDFVKQEPAYDEGYIVKNYLATKYNCHEVHTYLWNKTSFLKEINITKDNVKLLGKSEDNILRDDLNLSLLEVAFNNIKYYDEFNIMEIGTIIKDNENHKMLSILLCGPQKDLKNLYNKAKEMTVNILRNLKTKHQSLILDHQKLIIIKI